jgi:ribonuclease BN (tRNA processing enzyme)
MAIELTLLGTGGPRPDPERSQAAALVAVDGERYLVDCGDGTTQQLLRAGVGAADLTTLFLTHLHVDHCFGVAPFVYAGWYDSRGALRVYGPSLTQALVDDLFVRLYGADAAGRIANGRPAEGLQDAVVTEIRPGLVLESDVCRISALQVQHHAPSETYALRIEDSAGHVLVLSSDTGYFEPLAAFARDADILVHECYLRGGAQFTTEPSSFTARLSEVHVTPEQAGALGRLAEAKQLVLTHLPAGTDDADVGARASGAYGRPAVVARDFLHLRV